MDYLIVRIRSSHFATVRFSIQLEENGSHWLGGHSVFHSMLRIWHEHETSENDFTNGAIVPRDLVWMARGRIAARFVHPDTGNVLDLSFRNRPLKGSKIVP